jgi:hypothetical protein
MVQPSPEAALKPRTGSARRLLDFRFFVGDVLARHGIEFLGFHLVRMQPLVLGGREELTRSGGGDQLDFIAHECRSLNPDALGAQIRNDHVDAALFDGSQAPGGDAQADEPLLGLEPETMAMQVGQKAAALAIVRMGDRITRFRALARDLANSRHGINLWDVNAWDQPCFIPGRASGGNDRDAAIHHEALRHDVAPHFQLYFSNT